MAAFLGFTKRKEQFVEDESDDYLSISEFDTKTNDDDKDLEVRVFVLDNYENIRNILDVIRTEKTMCLIDIHLLRNKDPDELKRAIDKLKKTENPYTCPHGRPTQVEIDLNYFHKLFKRK